MHPDQLFLQRCHQLQELVQSDEQIAVLDLAARLRQMLIDNSPLYVAVNRNHLKIRYSVGYFTPDPHLEHVSFRSLEDGIDPETSRKGLALDLNLAKFLSHEVMTVRGKSVSVKDIILNLSNVSGGVHFDPKPSEKYQPIQEVEKVFGLGGLPAGFRAARAIGRVVLSALQPLIEDVEKRPPADR